MASPKNFVVIGLGSFGAALARRLCKNGCRVTGMDASRESVEALKDVLYEAIIGDATERETVEHLAGQAGQRRVCQHGRRHHTIAAGDVARQGIGGAEHRRQGSHAGARQVAEESGRGAA